MQGAQARSDNFQNKGHQVNFCKTQIEERSENGIENIYQSKGDNSINSVTKGKEWGLGFVTFLSQDYRQRAVR